MRSRSVVICDVFDLARRSGPATLRQHVPLPHPRLVPSARRPQVDAARGDRLDDGRAPVAGGAGPP